MHIKVRTLTGKEIDLDLSTNSSPNNKDAKMKDIEEEAADKDARMKDAGEAAADDGADDGAEGANDEANDGANDGANEGANDVEEFKDPKDIKISEIKERIEEKEGIPPDQQRLIFRGKQLHNNITIREAEIEPNATLHLVLALRGGRRET